MICGDLFFLSTCNGPPLTPAKRRSTYTRKRLRTLSFLLPLTLCLLFCASTAFAAGVKLAWDANSEPDLAGYTIHWGTSSGNYPFSVDVGNRTTWEVTGLDAGVTYYFAATAYNTSNLRSAPSDEVKYDVPFSDPEAHDGGSSDGGEQAVYDEDYSMYAAGWSPAGWLDTGAESSLVEETGLFEVIDFGGDMVFGTRSRENGVHSHYLCPEVDALSGYEFTGRMLMTDSNGGMGVTFFSQYPYADAYYRLLQHYSTSFYMSPHGTSVKGHMDTGVTPVPGVWYWFRILVYDTGFRTEILARVWPEHSAEPAYWQVDCYDDGPTRLRGGVIGLWSHHGDAFEGFHYRRPITIDHTKVSSSCPSGGLSDFPLLVDLSGEYLKTRAENPENGRVEHSKGYDIVFRALDDTTCGGAGKAPCTLDHEVESYSGEDGKLTAWVRIPELSTSSDTLIYMYYGNEEITWPTANPCGVWGSHFQGVWHLKEDPVLTGAGGILDSTWNYNDGTAYGWMGADDRLTAQIGDGLKLDGVDDYIDLGTFDPSSGDLTVSLWLRWGGATGDSQVIMAKRDSWATGDMRWQLAMWSGDGKLRFQDRNSGVNFGMGFPDTVNWHYFTVTRLGATGLTTLYIDGVQAGNTGTMSFGSDTNARVTVGGLTGGSESLKGAIDEVRFSSTVRDACWIQTEYNNQSAPVSFYSHGDEELIYCGSGGKYWDDLTVFALPPLPQYTLTVGPADSGTVSLDPPGGTYEQGAQVVLTATAAPGWEFAGWSGDLGGSANPATVIMDADMQVTALFTYRSYEYEENFSSYSSGSSPSGWVNTAAGNSLLQDNTVFQIMNYDGDKVFGTTSKESNIHSHYVCPELDTLSGYEFTGRMLMASSNSGIGVTFFSRYPDADAYYRLLRYYDNESFHILPRGTSVTGATDTGVSPVPDVWYWFRILVQDTGARTEILARVWPENMAEPVHWQVDCYDDSPTRLTGGAIGLWSHYYSRWSWWSPSDAKYWDDLLVTPLSPEFFQD